MDVLFKWIKPKQDVKDVIQEIHDTFYTEVDRLLAEAGIKHSLETEKEEVLNKGNRLKALGFTRAHSVSEAEEEASRLEDLKLKNQEKVALIEAITYFSDKYPQYKFITEESVIKICGKYGLIYGEVGKYKGNVPEKNLQDIENFKIGVEDKCYYYTKVNSLRLIDTETKHYCKKDRKKGESLIGLHYPTPLIYETNTYVCPFEIVAPKEDFDMTNAEISGFKLQDIPIPDPIVLQPVFHGDKKHYLIVTAWGLEGDDELVKNN